MLKFSKLTVLGTTQGEVAHDYGKFAKFQMLTKYRI